VSQEISLTINSTDISSAVQKYEITYFANAKPTEAKFYIIADKASSYTPALNQDVTFKRRLIIPGETTYSTTLFRGFVKNYYYENKILVIEAKDKLSILEGEKIDQEWSGQTRQTIMDDILDGTGLSSNITSATDTVDYLEAKNITRQKALQKFIDADASVIYIFYDSRSDVVRLIETDSATSVTVSRGADGNALKMKWKETDQFIINHAVVNYAGGTAEYEDSTSITNYGRRTKTFQMPFVDDYNTALDWATKYVNDHKDPLEYVEEADINVVKLAAIDGSGYEYFPLMLRATVTDSVTGKSTGTTKLNIYKYIMRGMPTKDTAYFTFATKRAKDSIEQIHDRIDDVERLLDQPVTTDSSVEFSGITSDGSIIPSSDATHNLGSSSKRWNNLYSKNIYAEPYLKIYTGYDDPNTFGLIHIIPYNNTKNAILRLFRDTDTSGSVHIHVFKGDNTATLTADLDAKNGDLWIASYCDADGGYRVGGTEVISSGRAISTTDLTIQKYGTLTLTHTASDNLKHSHDDTAQTNSSTYVKLKTITFPDGLAGNYRVKFDLRRTEDGIGYARIYKNGTPLGTEQSVENSSYETRSEDFTTDLEPGDTLELWGKLIDATGGYLQVRYFRVYYDVSESWVVSSSNS